VSRNTTKEKEMIESIANALNVSTSVTWAIIGLLAVQLGVQVWALVDLARRPRVRFEKKWIWALIIILGGNSFIGPIIYAAVGRSVPGEVAVDGGIDAATDDERTRRAVDTLYGGGGDR
jgi:hypothetical protein